VQFSRPMDRLSTAKAFSVVVAGKAVPGSITWDEVDTLLVFRPAAPLPHGAGVGVRIAGTALSAQGAPLGRGTSATFKVQAAPAPAKVAATETSAVKATAAKARPRTNTATTSTKPRVTKPATTIPKPKTSAGSSSWIAVEAYYLSLVNCTRTGGWVSSSGKCTGAGTRNVKALKLDTGISARVARPYAKRLATRGGCTHFAGSSPAGRLRGAGFGSHRWAENLSCPSGRSPTDTAIYSIRYFQSEKPWNGGHYRNLMNPAYDRVGVGIWVANGRVIIVTDFYKP